MDVEKFLKDSEKQFGKGKIIKLGSGYHADVPCLPTGIPGLDLALGVYGWPEGRIIEVYGPESSGKTTLTLTAIGRAQKQGMVCGIVDAEHALDPTWASKLGVNVDDLIISQPDNGEEGMAICEHMVKSGVNIVVVDSVAALVPKVELEGEMGQSHIGLQARLMSQGMRKLTGIIKKTKATVFFLNQIRMKIGVMYGNPKTTTGGEALKFYSSIRVEVNKLAPKDENKEGDKVVSVPIKMKVVKNKVAAPFKICETKIDFEKGFSLSSTLPDVLLDIGFVSKEGNTYYYNEEKIAVGKKQLKTYFEELSEEELEELYMATLEELKIGDSVEEDEEASEYEQILEEIAKLEKSIERKQANGKSTKRSEKRLAELQAQIESDDD